jgi:hypothetical protein
MTSDFRIRIERAGAKKLTLQINARTLGPAGRTYQRKLPRVASEQIELLRRGDPPDQVLEEVTQLVSDWLQKPDLDLPVMLQLADGASEPWRLIFHVPGDLNQNPQVQTFDLIDVPIELLTVEGDTPLVLHQRVSSVVHLLDKASSAPTTISAWPFKILIVRSNPPDLGADVPKAAPLRQDILKLCPDLVAQELIRVDVLSSEAAAGTDGIIGPPTLEALSEHLAKKYHVLVYLGHGDVQPPPTGMTPISVLQLESKDGSRREPASNKQLAQLLHDHVVPVVLLVGCLTAATFPAELQSELANWVRGSQGMAQSLINSYSGVQCALGMRCRIENDDALLFLKTFFASLLQPANDGPPVRGNVEVALRAARGRLRLHSPQALSWAAPVLFSTLPEEPVFRFLQSPPLCPVAAVAPQQDVRVVAWEAISMMNASMRSSGLYERMHKLLKDAEGELIKQVLDSHAAVIRPLCLEVPPGQPSGTVQIELLGQLSVEELEGTLVVGGEIGVQELCGTDALTAAGFKVFRSAGDKEVPFLIRRTGAGAGPLPEGPLIDVTIALSPATQVIYPVSLDAVRVRPHSSICSGRNVVIVPP